MSYLNKYSVRAYEMAYSKFFLLGYTHQQTEYYAKEFAKEAIKNLGVDLRDLLNDFVGDVRYADQCEADKERSLYA